MNCFYCGKRVSLVRKRIDADFCCDDHREKYHARTRRSMETLREAEEHMVVTRRLNEGIPLPAVVPLRGRSLETLVIKRDGAGVAFAKPTTLPALKPDLDTHIPAATLRGLLGARSNGAAPPPALEAVRWNLSGGQSAPRQPRAFTLEILLPKAELRRNGSTPVPCDRPRRLRAGFPVELGTRTGVVIRKLVRNGANSIGGMRRAIVPPNPVQPPPPSPPILMTLRQSIPEVRIRRTGSAVPRARIPQMGRARGAYAAANSFGRPQVAPRTDFEIRPRAVPDIRIASGAMPVLRAPRVIHRFVPNPEGFRRRQYYAWEPLERFCTIGFATIADYRPELNVAGAPSLVSAYDLSGVWARAMQDRFTIVPEGRRPAIPFHEQIALPQIPDIRIGFALLDGPPGLLALRSADAGRSLPAVRGWERLTSSRLAKHLGNLSRPTPVQWAFGIAERMLIPAWQRPQTRGAKRTACNAPIPVRQPAASGPEFAAGSRRAGPMAAWPVDPPEFRPAPAKVRHATIVATCAAQLPVSHMERHRLRQSEMLPAVCQAPVAEIPVLGEMHSAFPIVMEAALPSGHMAGAAAAPLAVQPPARVEGGSFDITKGVPVAVPGELLERFRRRGYEPMRSHPAAPRWPAPSAPGLARIEPHAPRVHARREPGLESAAALHRSAGQPALRRFVRVCALMDWSLLEPARPGAADCGRKPRTSGVPLPQPLVLPFDSLGPIRDWGLAPPPEPEKPPEPIHEDFAAGLANWLCAQPDWKQDIAGVRTGSLALLKPSLTMRDYELEFLGKIENRSLNWVFRAANPGNYFAARILLDGSGGAQFVRYAVSAGGQAEAVSENLPFVVAKSSSCRVRMSICGNNFKLFLNDRTVCDWSDERMSEGGVGFFSDGDDRARLYWVKVTPMHDASPDEIYQPMAPRSELYREVRMGV
jgi:hypothetical protein